MMLSISTFSNVGACRPARRPARGAARAASLLLAALLLAALLPSGVLSRAEPAAAGSLVLRYRHPESGAAVPGASFSLYQVASVARGELTFTAAFASCGVDPSSLLTPDDALMMTLASFAWGSGVSPLASGQTDGAGYLTFGELSPGLYLALGSPVTVGKDRYTPQPFAVNIPAGESVVVEPKFYIESIPDGPDTVARHVLKIWRDENHEDARPQEIVVRLLRDGALYDEVTLSEESGWRHEWQDLPGGSLYLIYEVTRPEGYSSRVEQQGVTFTVTNTLTDTDTDTNEPPPSSPPPDSPKLPQTGLTWWPVPLLLALGSVAIVVGAVLLTKKGKKKGQ